MKKLNRYIIKQILVGFLLVTFSLMSIIWLTQSLRFVDLITNNGIPVSIFAELTSLLMPRIFTILSPIAVFAAILFVYNRMLSDRELVVMKSAGISPMQCAVPAIIFGLLLSFFNIFVYNQGIPWSERKFSELQWKVKNDVSHLMFREGEFTELQTGLTVFITSHHKDGSVSGILINDERTPNVKMTVTSEQGRIVYTDKGPRIILVNGSRQEINTLKNQFTSLAFDRYSVDFGLSSKQKEKDTSARERSFSELMNADKDNSLDDKEKRKYIVEGQRRILVRLFYLLFDLFGCSGLLVGFFYRRGQSRIISIRLISMVILQALDLAFTNLANKNLQLLPLLYINLFVPLVICFYLLRFYRPGMFKRRRKNPEEFDNA